MAASVELNQGGSKYGRCSFGISFGDCSGGGHFHTASDMDVRQIRIRFFALKSAKVVFLASKVCKGCHFQTIKVSNIRKIITSFDQITETLRHFFNNAKIYS